MRPTFSSSIISLRTYKANRCITHIRTSCSIWGLYADTKKGYETITAAHILKGNTIVGYLLTEKQALVIVKTAAAAAGTTNIPLFWSLVAVEKSTRTWEFTKEEDNVPVFPSKKNTSKRISRGSWTIKPREMTKHVRLLAKTCRFGLARRWPRFPYHSELEEAHVPFYTLRQGKRSTRQWRRLHCWHQKRVGNANGRFGFRMIQRRTR